MKSALFFLFLVMLGLFARAEGGTEFQRGVDAFNTYREGTIRDIYTKTNGYRLPAAPFALLHPNSTKYSALLFHGLNDSPYYLKDIAELLYNRGMNVVSILLPGHALTVEDMNRVSYTDWLQTTSWALEIAQTLGENVLVGGFSTGGILATLAALDQPKIKGLLLFAPALEVSGPLNTGNRAAMLTCLKYINTLTFDSDIKENPIKYRTRSANSVCQLDLLVAHLYAKVGENIFSSNPKLVVKKIARQISVPTYILLTTEDHRVPPQAILGFAEALPGSRMAVVYTPDARKIKSFRGLEVINGISLSHSSLVLKTNAYNHQVNPYFDFVENSLKEFVRRYFSN